jgi:hypothetical protein
MVPLQATQYHQQSSIEPFNFQESKRTELLLDHLENLLLVKLLRKTLDSGQSLASITLCKLVLDMS